MMKVKRIHKEPKETITRLINKIVEEYVKENKNEIKNYIDEAIRNQIDDVIEERSWKTRINSINGGRNE